jgi:hypothetical protein
MKYHPMRRWFLRTGTEIRGVEELSLRLCLSSLEALAWWDEAPVFKENVSFGRICAFDHYQ